MVSLVDNDLNYSSLTRMMIGLMQGTPLVSARDLAGMMHRKIHTVYHCLHRLRDDGIVDSCSLSWYSDGVLRWHFTEDGRRKLFPYRMTWHDDWGRCRLLERLASLESFYHLVSLVQGLGRMLEFQWLDGAGVDAVVRYEDGWIALCWSGHLQSEVVIRGRIERFSREMDSLGVLDEMAWPGMFCFAVPDPWQRELVYRSLGDYGLGDNVAVWCMSDETCAAADELRPSRGWVNQYVQVRDLGGWPWEERLDGSILALRDNRPCMKVLDAVLEWPGITARMAGDVLGESSWGRRARVGLNRLFDRGYVSRQMQRRSYHYFVTSKGLDFLGRRDRVNFTRIRRRGEGLGWLLRPERRAHEEGMMGIASQFYSAGIPVAAGWRSWERLGDASIVPDGMALLSQSPYGPGWCYLEYERSARGRARVTRKLRGYGSPLRSNRWPVLVVCWDERSELVFHEVGTSLRLQMLTTTMARLASYPAVGGEGCWSRYGWPASVG